MWFRFFHYSKNIDTEILISDQTCKGLGRDPALIARKILNELKINKKFFGTIKGLRSEGNQQPRNLERC